MGLFNRKKPVELSALDRQTLTALREHGANLNEPRNLRCYLYFPDSRSAEAAATDVRSEGFTTDVHQLEADSDWSVVAERDGSVVNDETLPGVTSALEAIATRHQGDYDGWEASV